MNSSKLKQLTISMLVLSLGACTSLPDDPVKNDPEFAPVIPEDPETQVVQTGSLFQEKYANNLYSDIKAHRVGDIITVYLQESTSAKKKAKSDLDKSNNFSLDQITIPGGVAKIGGNPIELGLGQTSAFSGQGQADQSNSLNGNISVNVVKVLSNGNLVVRGEKWIMLNNGDEFVRLTGIVRAEDVSSDNTVSSMRIANARIQYGGTGDFANTQRQGWLTKFFNGPYWPL
ncbi:flagellar basal body L-ring protein FlgH [Motilimonas sp. 1_MG-2023]|uniref:flagellar basal body L-ring protein FlgH n=1 Tax=Motilimonas TaxID=1914248 RepID=UPI0026E452A6|nr:flagellar basal body L-ring protein FlgH [Motilimonas sp. 1_MG-2023]MDO6524947.1 flagellar basal body L-ring protein FlgH [Motilimonas sp. 1_MG-2023]